MYTDVYNRIQITAVINDVLNKLHYVIDNELKFSLNVEKNNVIINTKLQTLFNLRFMNDLHKRMYEIILNHAVSAEKLCPGSFDECIRLLLDYSNRCGDGNPGLLKKVNLSDTSSDTNKSCQLNDMSRIVSTYCGDNKLTSEIVLRAIELSGFGGKIIIENSSSSTPSIELNEGYAFDVTTMFNVTTKFERPRVLCIDGYIESVSEIHHLLESLSETKEQCLLFVRGMSDDVKHTLKVNYDRGTLRVIPVCVKFDLDGINTINDIAIVSASDLISSTKGDLISSLRLNDVSTVDSAVIYPSKIIIVNKRSRTSVLTHVKNLRVKRSEQIGTVDIGTLLDKRIKSLHSSHVVIRLPNDRNFVINSQSIDYALRAIKTAIETGVTERDGQVILAARQRTANLYAKKCFDLLLTLGSCINQVT